MMTRKFDPSQVSATEIIEIQTQLENSGDRTIERFMIRMFGYEYDKKPLANYILQVLKDTMVRVESQHPNGYTMYSWIDR